MESSRLPSKGSPSSLRRKVRSWRSARLVAAQLAVAEAARADEAARRTANIAGALAALSAGELARYDAQRARHGQISIAKLVGLRCNGCHLDLSRAEVDGFSRCRPSGRSIAAVRPLLVR